MTAQERDQLRNRAVTQNRFPPGLFAIFLGVMFLMSGIHVGLIVVMNRLAWGDVAQVVVAMGYWALVAAGLTWITRRQIETVYDKPARELAEATAKVADGDSKIRECIDDLLQHICLCIAVGKINGDKFAVFRSGGKGGDMVQKILVFQPGGADLDAVKGADIRKQLFLVKRADLQPVRIFLPAFPKVAVLIAVDVFLRDHGPRHLSKVHVRQQPLCAVHIIGHIGGQHLPPFHNCSIVHNNPSFPGFDCSIAEKKGKVGSPLHRENREAAAVCSFGCCFFCEKTTRCSGTSGSFGCACDYSLNLLGIVKLNSCKCIKECDSFLLL